MLNRAAYVVEQARRRARIEGNGLDDLLYQAIARPREISLVALHLNRCSAWRRMERLASAGEAVKHEQSHAEPVERVEHVGLS